MLHGNGVQTYNMKKGTNYGTAVNFTDSDNNWTATELNNNKDNAALDALGGKTYDYFSAVHGRNSYDNLGAAIKVTCIMTLLMTMLTGMVAL
jgi:Zn-dependent metalloprotease